MTAPDSIAAAEQDVAAALRDLENAVARQRALLDSGRPSEIDVLAARLDVDAAHVRLGRARLALMLLERSPT